MRAVAVMRERYGFTATETMNMTIPEFVEWLEALDDSKDKKADDGRETLVNVETPGQCIDKGRLGRLAEQLI
jgi:hypothetical protein